MPNFINRLPDLYKGGESRRLLEAIEGHRSALEKRIDAMGTWMDPDLCPPEWLDVHLRLLGWTLQLDFSERQKRKLVKMARVIHQQSGTTKGLKNALRYLIGEEPTVVEYLKERYKANGTAYPPEEDELNYTFSVEFPMLEKYFTADLQAVRDIVEYMRAPNTYWVLKLVKTDQVPNAIKARHRIFLVHKRNIWANNGEPRDTGLRLDGSWKLDGSRTMNNPTTPGMYVSKRSFIFNRTDKIPTAQNKKTQFGWALDGTQTLDGKLIMSGSREETASITSKVTLILTPPPPQPDPDKQLVVNRSFRTANIEETQGYRPLDGSFILDGKTIMRGTRTEIRSVGVRVKLNGNEIY